MIGRTIYYGKKAFALARSNGLRSMARTTLEFASRRILSGELLLEPLEYHFLAKNRDIMQTLIRVAQHTRPPTEKTKRWMIYASYDSQSTVQPHIKEQLGTFQRLGYAI